MSLRPLPIVATKLAPPKRSGASLRPDTLALIQRGGQRRLLFVQAPAGYGKTTVVAEAARTFQWRVAWYKLDILDQDPIVFAASLAESVRRVVDGFGTILRDRLADVHDAPLSTHEALGILAAELNNEVTGHLHIVLDDYQETANSSALNAALDYLLSSLPENIHVAVLSRYEPSFQLSRLRLADDLIVLEREDLRFSREQTASYLESQGLRDLQPTHLEYIFVVTEGWPTGLALVANALAASRQRGDETILASPFVKGDLYTYLAEQVYGKESADVRSFLRQSAALEYMTPELAEAVTLIPRAGNTLSQLTARCLFTFRTDKGHYRYHPLFREYLKYKALQEDGVSAFQQTQLRAAHALERAGDYQASVELLLTVREENDAVRLLASCGERWLDSCTTQTIARWAECFSSEDPRLRGWARLLLGCVAFREARHDEAIEHFESCVRTFDELADAPARYQALSALERALYWSGQYQLAASVCCQALANTVVPLHTVHSLISRAAALIQSGDWAPAKQCLQEARSLPDSVEHTEHARLIAQELTLAYYQGQFRYAHAKATSNLSLVLEHLPSSFQIAYLHVIGMLDLHLGLYDRVVDHLLKAKSLADRVGYRLCEPHILDTEGQLLIAIGSLTDGLSLLHAASSSDVIQNDHGSLALIRSHIGTAYRRAGDFDQAKAAYATALSTAQQSSNQYAIETCHLNAAYCDALSDGRLDTSTIKAIGERAAANGLLFLANKCSLFGGVIAWRARRLDSTLTELQCITSQMLASGQVHVVAQEMAAHADLLPLVTPRLASRSNLHELVEALACLDTAPRILDSMLRSDSANVASLVLRVGMTRLGEEARTVLISHAMRHSDSQVRKYARTASANSWRMNPTELPELTPRETEVLAMMAHGRRNGEIAERLYLAPGTVKSYVNRIFSKLGVTDRVSAVLIYHQRAAEARQSEHHNPLPTTDSTKC